MNKQIRILAAAALACSLNSFAQAAAVTDVAGKESFRGCWYLTCLPGKNEPIGLVSSPATFSLSNQEVLSITSQVNGAGLTVASVTRDDASGALLASTLSGSFTLSVSPQLAMASGGSVTVSNLAIDVATKRVTADLAGHRDAYRGTAGEDFTLAGVALWSFSQLAGPASFNPAAITRGPDGASLAVYSVSGLTLTADGLEAFTRGLGLQSFGAAALTGQNLGSLSLDLHYGHSVAAVPEPSAWAMMGIGLVGLALTRRFKGASRA